MAINLTITNSVIPASSLIVFSTQYSGTVNATAVTTITGTAAEIITVYSSSGIIGLGNESLTLTGIHTVAQLQAINNATTGTITLENPSVALWNISGFGNRTWRYFLYPLHR